MRTKYLPLLLVAFLAGGLFGQESPCTTRTLLVNVIGQEGKPAQVSADSFRAKYRGRPVDILSVTSEAKSRRIVLLLDASGSMQEALKWEAEKLLARDIVRGLPNSSFALMIFASGIQDKVGFAQGPAALAKKLNDLPSELQTIPKGEGKTALYDAILAGLDELGPPREGDVIYITTDGNDNKSSSEPFQVEPRLLSAGVRLFAFLLPEPLVRGRTPEGNADPQKLEELVRHTGGGAAVATFEVAGFSPHRLSNLDLSTIPVLARQLYPLMEQSYRLQIKMPPGINKPRDWSLEVMDGRRTSHLRVIYPRLSPCAAQNP